MASDELLEPALATFLFQVIDEYTDAGYLPIGYGWHGAHLLTHAGASVIAIVDDDTADVLTEIAQPICLVVLEAHRHNEIVTMVKEMRQHNKDVFVRWFPTKEVTQ